MKFKMVMLSAMTLATMSAQAQSFHYPKAPQSDAKDRYFDVEIADPFRPLEDDIVLKRSNGWRQKTR